MAVTVFATGTSHGQQPTHSQPLDLVQKGIAYERFCYIWCSTAAKIKVHMVNEQQDYEGDAHWDVVENSIGPINYTDSVDLVYNPTINIPPVLQQIHLQPQNKYRKYMVLKKDAKKKP